MLYINLPYTNFEAKTYSLSYLEEFKLIKADFIVLEVRDCALRSNLNLSSFDLAGSKYQKI